MKRMTLHEKKRLMNKIARIADKLGYDVARLTRPNEAKLAHELSEAVGALRLVQGKLAIHIAAHEDFVSTTQEKTPWRNSL